jgi:hypothetical protein
LNYSFRIVEIECPIDRTSVRTLAALKQKTQIRCAGSHGLQLCLNLYSSAGLKKKGALTNPKLVTPFFFTSIIDAKVPIVSAQESNAPKRHSRAQQ